jgi:hypothetical protein
MSLIGAPLNVMGVDHHENHGAMVSLAIDADIAHAEHSSHSTGVDGMCCASGTTSCVTVAVLLMDDSPMSPLQLVSMHTSTVDSIMIDGVVHRLERPPRFS